MSEKKYFEGNIRELAKKSAIVYNPREIALIQHIYPDLNKLPKSDIEKLFEIKDKRLSVFEIGSLAMMFPQKSPEQIRAFLLDEKAIQEYVDVISHSSQSNKQRFWQLFSILPLSEEIEKYILQKFDGQKEDEALTEETSEAKSDEEVSTWTPMRVNLPIGSLPHLDTYLASAAGREHFDVPRASIYITNTLSGDTEAIELSEQETAAAMAYARNRLEYIEENRDKLTQDYRKSHGLAEDSEIDISELKNFYFKKFTYRRLQELVSDKFSEKGRILDENEVELQLKFSQRKKGLSKRILSVVSSSEKLNDHFSAKMEKTKPSMISLTFLNNYIKDGQIFSLEELPTSEYQDFRKTSFPEKKIINGQKLNELQQAYTEISRATKSGDWNRAIEVYINYLDYWPQYIEHRLGAVDIVEKTKAGLISKFPERVMSVASGPHEELRALYDISKKLGYPLPEVVSLDSSLEMLQSSRKKLPDEIKQSGQDIAGDMKNIPFGNNAFDMVECSSFDNLKDDNEIKDMLVSIATTLKVSGTIRFMVGEPFSDQICEVFEKNGFTILEKNKRPKLSEEAEKQIDNEMGSETLKRIQYKLKRHVYFLARLDNEINPDTLRKDLNSSPVFSPRKRLTANHIKEQFEERAQRGVENAALDYSINLTVARNPNFFLDQKHLRPEYLLVALEGLKEHIDFSDAVFLYKKYFSDPRLTSYCDKVLKILMEFPEAKRYLSINLIGHENEKVRKLFKSYFNEHFASYVSLFLESNFSEEVKKEILKGVIFDKETLNKLSAHLSNISLDESKFISLAYVFECLPKGVKLDLPIEMRFIEPLSGIYAEFSNDFVAQNEYSESEIKKYFSRHPTDIEPDEKLITLTFKIIKAGDVALANDLFRFLKHQNEEWVSELIRNHESNIQGIILELKESAGPEKLVELQAFEKQYLGSFDLAENEKALRDLLSAHYRKVYDTYFIPRKNIKTTGGDFLRDTNEMCLSFAQEHKLSQLEVFLMLNDLTSEDRDTSYHATSKAKDMAKMVSDFVYKKCRELSNQVDMADIDTKLEILRILENSRYTYKVSDIQEKIENMLKNDPEVVTRPKFLQEITSIIEETDLNHLMYNPLMKIAVKYRENISTDDLKKFCGMLSYIYLDDRSSFADFTTAIQNNPGLLDDEEFVGDIAGKKKGIEVVFGLYRSLSEVGQRNVQSLMKKWLLYYYEKISESEMKFIKENGLNEFKVLSLGEQFDRGYDFNGYLARFEDAKGKIEEIFVPKSLVKLGYGREDFNNMRLQIVPSNKGNGRVVGTLYYKEARQKTREKSAENEKQNSYAIYQERIKNWKTKQDLRVLARKLDVPDGKVFGIANIIRQEHPEWVEDVRDERLGNAVTRYSPEFIGEIEKRLKE